MVFPSILVAHPAMYRNRSAARGTSATRATVRGLPLSSDSNCANSSRCFSIKSPSFQIMRPRSEGVIFDHGGGRLYGPIDILFVPFGNAGQDVAGGGI